MPSAELTSGRHKWTVLGTSLIVVVGLVVMSMRALPRLEDGATEIRRVQHVMHDEALILERVWAMVERGDLRHSVGVYPGLYPYTVAGVRLAVGREAPTETAVLATRGLSWVMMVLGILVSFIGFSAASRSVPAAGLFCLVLCLHPETALWASRVHPDASLVLLDHASLALLAIYVEQKKRWLLTAATILAALSAGTKLVGCFIMVIIAATVLWEERKSLRVAAHRILGLSAVFLLVFVLCNPLMLQSPAGVVRGFLIQEQRNRLDGAGRAAWAGVLYGSRGLGLSGSLIVLVGLVRLVQGKLAPGMRVIAAFGLFYFAYVFSSVSLAMPRYAIPGMWPLLFVGIAALADSGWSAKLRVALGSVALLTFAALDVPAMSQDVREDATKYRRDLSEEKELVGRKLLEMAGSAKGRIVSSYRTYVPPDLPWSPIWSLETEVIPKDAFAIVIDGALRRPEGAKYQELTRGLLGFTATATIGDFVIYTRTAHP